jgi:hypothetical protein
VINRKKRAASDQGEWSYMDFKNYTFKVIFDRVAGYGLMWIYVVASETV